MVTRSGLVMNNRCASPGACGDVDTNMTIPLSDPNDPTSGTLNMVDIPDDQLDEWHEFWITIEAVPEPSGILLMIAAATLLCRSRGR